MEQTQLLIIDPQVDFCDPSGALYVTGADTDSTRLATFIKKSLDYIDDIRVTLGSHQPIHIAHPICWVNNRAENPNPFTIISLEDVEGKDAVWFASNPGWQKRQVEYVRALNDGGRYVLCIWLSIV